MTCHSTTIPRFECFFSAFAQTSSWLMCETHSSLECDTPIFIQHELLLLVTWFTSSSAIQGQVQPRAITTPMPEAVVSERVFRFWTSRTYTTHCTSNRNTGYGRSRSSSHPGRRDLLVRPHGPEPSDLNRLPIASGGLIVLRPRYFRVQYIENLALKRHCIVVDNLNYGVLSKLRHLTDCISQLESNGRWQLLGCLNRSSHFGQLSQQISISSSAYSSNLCTHFHQNDSTYSASLRERCPRITSQQPPLLILPEAFALFHLSSGD